MARVFNNDRNVFYMVIDYADCGKDEAHDVVEIRCNRKDVSPYDVYEAIERCHKEAIENVDRSDYDRVQEVEEALDEVCEQAGCEWHYVDTAVATLEVPE